MQCLTVPTESGLQEVCLLLFLLFLTQSFLLCIGAADAATHKIYIWDISNDGQFTSTLDGGREPLVHLHVGTLLVSSLTRFYFLL